MEFQSLFLKSEGKPIIYNGKEIIMVDRISLLTDNIAVKVTFIATNSKWKQGIVLQTKGEFDVNAQQLPNRIVLWEDKAPKENFLTIRSKDKILNIYNVWKTEDGTIHYWHNGGAMNMETINEVRIYNCNDGFPDEDFDDLVFKVEIK
ncbi:MAG: hypothetical protein ABJA78_11865 [Ferruginibacter sp.]